MFVVTSATVCTTAPLSIRLKGKRWPRRGTRSGFCSWGRSSSGTRSVRTTPSIAGSALPCQSSRLLTTWQCWLFSASTRSSPRRRATVALSAAGLPSSPPPASLLHCRSQAHTRSRSRRQSRSRGRSRCRKRQPRYPLSQQPRLLFQNPPSAALASAEIPVGGRHHRQRARRPMACNQQTWRWMRPHLPRWLLKYEANLVRRSAPAPPPECRRSAPAGLLL